MRKMHLRMLALATVIVCLPAFSRPAAPQEATETKQPEPKQVSVYHLEYIVTELEDGKRINSRNYSLSAGTDGRASLRVGSRVPYSTGPASTQYQYQDVGVNIDCQPQERGGVVFLWTRFASSGMIPPDTGTSNPYAPLFREVKFDGTSIVNLSKPTVIALLDDVATNRRYEVEVTVTKVK